MHSAVLKTNTLDSWGVSDVVMKRNNVDFLQFTTDIPNGEKILANKVIQCGGNLLTQEHNNTARYDIKS